MNNSALRTLRVVGNEAMRQSSVAVGLSEEEMNVADALCILTRDIAACSTGVQLGVVMVLEALAKQLTELNK